MDRRKDRRRNERDKKTRGEKENIKKIDVDKRKKARTKGTLKVKEIKKGDCRKTREEKRG